MAMANSFYLKSKTVGKTLRGDKDAEKLWLMSMRGKTKNYWKTISSAVSFSGKDKNKKIFPQLFRNHTTHFLSSNFSANN